jgi:hypothetical protein
MNEAAEQAAQPTVAGQPTVVRQPTEAGQPTGNAIQGNAPEGSTDQQGTDEGSMSAQQGTDFSEKQEVLSPEKEAEVKKGEIRKMFYEVGVRYPADTDVSKEDQRIRELYLRFSQKPLDQLRRMSGLLVERRSQPATLIAAFLHPDVAEQPAESTVDDSRAEWLADDPQAEQTGEGSVTTLAAERQKTAQLLQNTLRLNELQQLQDGITNLGKNAPEEQIQAVFEQVVTDVVLSRVTYELSSHQKPGESEIIIDEAEKKLAASWVTERLGNGGNTGESIVKRSMGVISVVTELCDLINKIDSPKEDTEEVPISPLEKLKDMSNLGEYLKAAIKAGIRQSDIKVFLQAFFGNVSQRIGGAELLLNKYGYEVPQDCETKSKDDFINAVRRKPKEMAKALLFAMGDHPDLGMPGLVSSGLQNPDTIKGLLNSAIDSTKTDEMVTADIIIKAFETILEQAMRLNKSNKTAIFGVLMTKVPTKLFGKGKTKYAFDNSVVEYLHQEYIDKSDTSVRWAKLEWKKSDSPDSEGTTQSVAKPTEQSAAAAG